MKFLKNLVVMMMVAFASSMVFFICGVAQNLEQTPEFPTKNYNLQNGNYQMVTEFIDAVSGAREKQTLVVTVENSNGNIQIKAVSSDRGFVFANPIVGTLNSNDFAGSLDDVGGRLDVKGNLTANNVMKGGFYEGNGSQLTSFVMRKV